MIDWPSILLAALAATLIHQIIFRPWPWEVSESEAEVTSNPGRCSANGAASDSLTSWSHDLITHTADERSAGSRNPRGLETRLGTSAATGAAVFDWAADGFGDAA